VLCYTERKQIEATMKNLLKNGLLANAASLGVHWIYDHKLLEDVSQKQSLLCLAQQKELYEKASSAYYSYPNQELGDVSFQGNILIWLYLAIQKNPKFTKDNYDQLIYTHLKPGSVYDGYIESYAKTLLSYHSLKKSNPTLEQPPKDDDHLVGFMPYLAFKRFDLSSEHAFELTKLFSEDLTYLEYFYMFDHLFEFLQKHDKKKAITNAIPYAPKKYHDVLLKATEIKDTNTFIDNYAGRACAIQYSIPVIIHVLYHQDCFLDALQKNALIGGSVADRATLIGAIYGEIEKPQEICLKKMSKLLDI
jgi:hypothetical protein